MFLSFEILAQSIWETIYTKVGEKIVASWNLLDIELSPQTGILKGNVLYCCTISEDRFQI